MQIFRDRKAGASIGLGGGGGTVGDGEASQKKNFERERLQPSQVTYGPGRYLGCYLSSISFTVGWAFLFLFKLISDLCSFIILTSVKCLLIP
jgi:hypothetical protein